MNFAHEKPATGFSLLQDARFPMLQTQPRDGLFLDASCGETCMWAAMP